MKVMLSHKLFEGTTWDHWLHVAFYACRRQEHRIMVPHQGQQALKCWLKALQKNTSERFQTQLDQGCDEPEYADAPPVEVWIEPEATPYWPVAGTPKKVRLPPDDGVLDFLAQPLRILVENDRSDFGFLRRAAPHAWKRRAAELFASSRVEAENGGGNANMRCKVEEQLLPDARRRLRTWALLDSDSPHPELVADEAKLVEKALRQADVLHHRLQRRAIENYVPIPDLDQWAAEKDAGLTRKAWLNEFRRLEAPQRHHIKLKSGENGGFRKHTKIDDLRVQALYGARLNDSTHMLWKGPPGDLGERWLAAEEMQSEWLKNDGSDGELAKLYQSLFGAL
jgi:hypothetical protein